MAVGFPAKTSFTDGAVLPASDLNDITGTLNSLVPTSSLPWTTSWSPNITGGWTATGSWSTYYTQIGKIVHFAAVFTLTNITTPGTFIMSLPVTARAAASQMFTGYCNAGGGAYSLTGRMNSTTTLQVYANGSAASYVNLTNLSNIIPGTWATGNILSVNGSYEAA